MPTYTEENFEDHIEAHLNRSGYRQPIERPKQQQCQYYSGKKIIISKTTCPL